MSHRSRRDPNHISQHEHNEELDAKRVEIVSADMSIELDADDGDSVQTQGRLFEYSNVQNDTPMPCGACKEVNLCSNTPVQLMVSPDDSGETWLQVAETVNNSLQQTGPVQILAKRMKVTGMTESTTVKILGRG
jgi:hypothetical protein